MYKILLFLLTFCTLVQAQKYVSFPTDSAEWRYEQYTVTSPIGPSYYTAKTYFSGNTVINGTSYKMATSYPYNTTRAMVFRDDTLDRKVYFMIVDSNYAGHPGYNLYQEYVLYDFNLLPGDTLSFSSPGGGSLNTIYVSSVDSVVARGITRKRINFSSQISGMPYTASWVEGVGSMAEFLGPIADVYFESGSRLYCFKSHPSGAFYEAGGFHQLDCSDYVGEEEFELRPLKVYPSPAEDILMIENSKPFDLIQIYSLAGKLIYTERFSEKLNTEQLQPGMYFLRVSDGNRLVGQTRFVKR